MILPAGRDVKLFNDDCFSHLRQISDVPDSFLNEGFSLDNLVCGDAKGGCLMAFIGSDFVVKELSDDDHRSLLRISQSYFQHVRDGDTLLSLILLHFEDTATGRFFYAMRNVLGSGPFLAMYDLKGCNDDKTLELFGNKIRAASMLISSAGRLCGYLGTQDWHAYKAYSAGKWAASRADLLVTDKQREEVISRMRRDTDWLASHQLMDYSLLVGVKTGPPGFSPGASLGRVSLVRGCTDGSEVAVCVGIIDFLQRWNLKKMAARAIKCLECNKATIPPAAYAMRFCDYFEERFVSTKAAPSPYEGKLSITDGIVTSAESDDAALLENEDLAKFAPVADVLPNEENAVGASIHEKGALLEKSVHATMIGSTVA